MFKPCLWSWVCHCCHKWPYSNEIRCWPPISYEIGGWSSLTQKLPLPYWIVILLWRREWPDKEALFWQRLTWMCARKGKPRTMTIIVIWHFSHEQWGSCVVSDYLPSLKWTIELCGITSVAIPRVSRIIHHLDAPLIDTSVPWGEIN